MGLRGAVLSLIAVVALVGGRSIVYADEGLQLEVVVDDRAGVRPLVLDQARKQASRIYKHAGVTLVWHTAAPPTDAVDGRPKLEVGFTVRAVIHARFRGAVGPDSRLTMGAAPDTALKCGGVVHLFFDQIFAYSSITLHDTALVLGTVAAHEIGHVLLSRGGHAEEGLMGASWRPDDWARAAAGFLVFSPHEREAVRRRIPPCRQASEG